MLNFVYHWIKFRRSDIPVHIDIPLVTRPTLEYLTKLHEMDRITLGTLSDPVVRFMSLIKPHKSAVIIGEPDLMREVFSGTHWRVFNRPHISQSPQLGHAGGLILMDNGEKWKEARAVFSSRFTTSAVHSYLPTIERETDVLIRILKERSVGGAVLDMQVLLNQFTFDAIVQTIFGSELSSLETGDTTYLNAWSDVLSMSNFMVLVEGLLGQWAWSVFGLTSRYNKAYLIIRKLAEDNLKRSQTTTVQDGCILDDVLREESTPDWMKTTDEMVQQLMTLLFAGFDTTSSTMSFAIAFLAENFEWQEKLFADIDALANLDASNLESSPILTAVIKETLRLRPSAVFGAGRSMSTDLDIEWKHGSKRATLYKAELVIAAPYIVQTHPANYADALKFSPNRWLEDPMLGGATGGNHFSYVPFGAGARKCVGEKMAWLEMRVVLANIVKNFSWQMVDESDFEQEFIGTIRLLKGCKVKLVPRAV